MALIEGWLPPTRENWELLVYVWQFFPIFASAVWLTEWYPMGKTSIISRFNIPGKIGWATMEAPGFIILLYIMFTLPTELGIDKLPFGNWTLAGLFTMHYIYRALLAPLVLNPSMSPIHAFVWLSALSFQIMNAISLGGWLGGHGPTTDADWVPKFHGIYPGLLLFFLGFGGNIFHDDDLREIRRAAARKQERLAKEKGVKPESVEKTYMIPKNGLFAFVLFAHYLCEWVEWAGFWMIAGWDCVPARAFLINEISSMLPRAVNGKRWYIEKFGVEKVGRRKAVIPGIL